jgi:hypothetical protein
MCGENKELRAALVSMTADRDDCLALSKLNWTAMKEARDKVEELRAALVSAIDAMEDFDYDKRLKAIAKCREVLNVP